jgi:hypothetical protein
MVDSPQKEVDERADRPGKTRTWWHPLLVRLLDHVLSTAYWVQDEVPVGQLPLRVDILLMRRQTGQLSEANQRDASALVALLNRFTLVEFKAPTDSLATGDLARLFGCAFLWHSQQAKRVAIEEVSLIVLAPRVNEALKSELLCLGCELREEQPGVHRAVAAPFTTWLVETDIMAQRGVPILALVSRVFLHENQRIMRELSRSGHSPLLYYALQQVQQFRRLGEDFAMQHADSEFLVQMEDELQAALLESLPLEKRLQGLSPQDRLQGLSAKELAVWVQMEDELQAALLESLPLKKRLQGLSPQDRVQGLSPEELAACLTEDQAARLWQLLSSKKSSH